jgi:CheY-like chemotaxis protein
VVRPAVPERFSVLVVASDVDLHDLLRGELERRGRAAARVATGDAALDRLEERHYDVVLIDLRALGVPGTELIRGIRRLEDSVVPRTSVMVYAPYAGAGEMALAAGADDYLAARCVPSHLVARMGSCASGS